MESFQLLHSFWITASWRLNFLALPWSLIIIQLLTALKTNNSFHTNNIKYNPGNDFLSFSSYSILTGWLAYEWTQMKQNEVDKRNCFDNTTAYQFVFLLLSMYFFYFESAWNRDMCEMKGKKSDFIYLFNIKSVHEQRGE